MRKEEIHNAPIQSSEEDNEDTIYSEINVGGVDVDDDDEDNDENNDDVDDDENNDDVDDNNDEYDADVLVNDLSNSDDEKLYSLFSIPVVGVICAVLVFIFKRYRMRILLGFLKRLFDWLDGGESESSLPTTTTTSADTTLVKTRVHEDQLPEYVHSLYATSSISTPSGSAIWTNRILQMLRKYMKILKEVELMIPNYHIRILIR